MDLNEEMMGFFFLWDLRPCMGAAAAAAAFSHSSHVIKHQLTRNILDEALQMRYRSLGFAVFYRYNFQYKKFDLEQNPRDYFIGKQFFIPHSNFNL
ncbi:hypothetical protein NC652_031315 [Populus alba x Populus x berolinensis]|nr:hypothetical protein NC652_031315 [Populus alba x Populus x berolinensis]